MKRLLYVIAIFPIFVHAQFITTVAGNGILGYSGDGGPATAAKLHLPGKVITDASGNIYIADSWGHRVRKVDNATGIITTIAGTGVAGYNGDGIPATSAKLNDPCGLALDANGDLYIADINNNRIRKIDHNTGVITTMAGNGINAFSGDGGPATSASLGAAGYIVFDESGNLFIADNNNFRIRVVSVATGIISTVAGNGFGVGTVSGGGYNGDGIPATAAELNYPGGIAIFGNPSEGGEALYFADSKNYRIRKVDLASGIIITVAGNGILGYIGDGTPATSAEVQGPTDIAFDKNGNYYIAEFNGRVRKVDTNGIITRAAGADTFGYNGDGILADTAKLDGTFGIFIDACGDLYIADHTNERIRKVAYPPILSVPVISLSGSAATTVGTTVTVNATVSSASSSYIIYWMNHNIEFTTTTVPYLTYTKTPGRDTITAKIVPTGPGCYDSATSAGWVVSDASTGTYPQPAPKEREVLRTYPNPVKDILYIDNSSAPLERSGEVYKIRSVVGSSIQQGILQQGSNTINVKELPAGVYMLEVVYPSGNRVTTKIIKQ